MSFDWFLGEQKGVGRGLLRIKNFNFVAELFDEFWPALVSFAEGVYH